MAANTPTAMIASKHGPKTAKIPVPNAKPKSSKLRAKTQKTVKI